MVWATHLGREAEVLRRNPIQYTSVSLSDGRGTEGS